MPRTKNNRDKRRSASKRYKSLNHRVEGAVYLLRYTEKKERAERVKSILDMIGLIPEPHRSERVNTIMVELGA